MCHGENGVNPRPGYVPMVGVQKFDRIDTPKTVTYYKYATTLFDVTRRSMPYQMPRTLTNDEVYALSAYILSLNKIIGENEVMNAETLPKVKMPNRDNFIVRYRQDLDHRARGPQLVARTECNESGLASRWTIPDRCARSGLRVLWTRPITRKGRKQA